MTKCYFCKSRLDDIPYRCKFCGMIFCRNHRLPENHKCPFDLKAKSIDLGISESKMLYQDALDYIEKGLSVAKIYELVTTKQMNEMVASDLLTHFIETSEEIEIRINSIMAFKVLNLKNKTVFEILESIILSEENPEVKKTALAIITDLFPKRSIDVRHWVKRHVP